MCIFVNDFFFHFQSSNKAYKTTQIDVIHSVINKNEILRVMDKICSVFIQDDKSLQSIFIIKKHAYCRQSRLRFKLEQLKQNEFSVFV